MSFGFDRIAERDDPCWRNPKWRTLTLQEMVERQEVSKEELSCLTDRSMNTIKFWLGGHEAVIPANTLRLVMFEVARKSL